MKEIKLGGKLASSLNLVALVDDEDFERLNLIKWHASKSKMKNGSISTYYAIGSKLQSMHRFILGLNQPQIKVDHRNRNGLDNQKHNLRIPSGGQNQANRPKSITNTTGFKGAYRSGDKFNSIISFNDKLKYLGSFSTAEEAARAYDAAATAQWGEFACLNFPRTAA